MNDETISKVLFIVVGLVVLGLVLGYGVGVIRDGMDSGNKAQSDINKMNVALSETEFTQYDATEILGSNVINLIKKYEQEKGQICITVNNGRSETEYVMNSALTDRATTKAVDAKKKSDLSLYINPSSLFLGEVVRDPDTDTIIGLKFTKVD